MSCNCTTRIRAAIKMVISGEDDNPAANLLDDLSNLLLSLEGYPIGDVCEMAGIEE